MPASVDSTTADDGSAPCGASETGIERYRYRAAWDRAAGLVVSMSPDSGVTWQAPVIADGRPGARSCGAALFADSVNRYLHVAYSIEAPGRAAVYYVHSMNAARLSQHGEGMFEQPIVIVYGNRAVHAGVASRGDTVAVVYEDPNSPRGRIQLALSTTGGHSFDLVTTVPAGSANAKEPHVGLRGGSLSVTWRETGTEGDRLVRRVGRFR